MKTLQDIKEGFKSFDVAKIVCKGECEDYGLKYYIQDYTDMEIKSINDNSIEDNISVKSVHEKVKQRKPDSEMFSEQK